MNYFTAKSYENYERVGDPFYNAKNKLCTKVKCSCPRCGGLGIIVARVENGQPIPIPVDGGVCYKCGGSGVVHDTVRLYTEAERNRLDAAAERAQEKRKQDTENRRLAELESNKAKWLADNNFNEDGTVYIVKGDSYSIKEDLKKAGFRFDSTLLWHAGQPNGYEDRVVKTSVEELGEWTAWGKLEYFSNIKEKVKEMTYVAAAASPSQYVGEVKERLRNIKARCSRIYSFEGYYGTTTVYTFVDENENVFTWFTSSYQDIEEGDNILLTGTVKEHKEYREVKQTVLTRCKVEVM